MSAQLTLDGRDTRVKVEPIRGFTAPCFGAKCAACGAWLTKWDFSEQDAEAVAVHALERTDGRAHVCGAS